jgi:hypothetical protein
VIAIPPRGIVFFVGLFETFCAANQAIRLNNRGLCLLYGLFRQLLCADVSNDHG